MAEEINFDKQALELGCECKKCPFARTKCGPVIPERVTSSRFVVVVGAPTLAAVRIGRLATHLLGRGLRVISSTQYTLCSAIACAPKAGNIGDWLYDHRSAISKGVIESPIRCCRPLLRRYLARAKVVATLGDTAFKAIAALEEVRIGKVDAHRSEDLPLAPLSEQRGHPYRLPSGRWLMPTYDVEELFFGQKHLLHVAADDLLFASQMPPEEEK